MARFSTPEVGKTFKHSHESTNTQFHITEKYGNLFIGEVVGSDMKYLFGDDGEALSYKGQYSSVPGLGWGLRSEPELEVMCLYIDNYDKSDTDDEWYRTVKNHGHSPKSRFVVREVNDNSTARIVSFAEAKVLLGEA